MPRAPRRPTLAAPGPRLALLALVVPLVLAACDTAPGAPALVPEPPGLADFAVSPDSFRLEGAAPEAVIPLVLTGSVTTPGGAAAQLRYLVRRQGDDTLTVSGEVDVFTAGAFTAQEELRLPRGASGAYIVEAVAVSGGRIGGRASGLFHFRIDPLGPPVVEGVELDPAVVTAPASGSARLRIVATVSDPDGRANLGYVTLRQTGTEGPLLPLSDGGSVTGSGDDTARDGRYTVTLQIGAGSPPGQYGFEVLAADREGLEATPFPFTVTVQ
ncbi:MAG TPA: hypothetical protein VK610_09445 [Rhodothermales bacterium]|nr:hypothetical protein [Rhodothermales bacterium]